MAAETVAADIHNYVENGPITSLMRIMVGGFDGLQRANDLVYFWLPTITTTVYLLRDEDVAIPVY